MTGGSARSQQLHRMGIFPLHGRRRRAAPQRGRGKRGRTQHLLEVHPVPPDQRFPECYPRNVCSLNHRL